MKIIPKHIIILSGIILFILFGYLIFQKVSSSQSDDTKNTVSQSDTGINTNKAIAQSGNQWESNPFQTGSSNTGSESTEVKNTKPVFQKPNTEWKTRTLSGITYVFGEGNPKEVALDVNQIEQYFENIAPQNDYGDHGYVTIEVEKLLLELLSHPNFPLFIDCFSSDKFLFPTKNSQYIDIFDLTRPGFLDINNLLFINQDTGRKEIDTTRLISLVWFLRDQVYPVESSENTQVADTCKQNNGAILYQIAEKLRKKYSNF